MHSQLSRGVENHKQVSREKQGWILHLYYTNRTVLGWLCGFNEAFFAMLYLQKSWVGPVLPGVNMPLVPFLLIVATPGMLVKQAINFVQFKQACVDIVNDIDEPKRLKQQKSI